MLFTLAYLKSKFKKILLNETEVIPNIDEVLKACVKK
jgi:hypothetical protein